MMASIGSRYLVFASLYGRSIYWFMGVSLILAANLVCFLAPTPVIAAGLDGLIELLFGVLVLSKTTTALYQNA
jgi:hypothetical protein